jgi:hypothetical protein
MIHSYRNSRPEFGRPSRTSLDPCERFRVYGRIRPMSDQKSLLERLLGR